MSLLQVQFVQQETINIKDTHPILQCIINNKLKQLKLLLKKHDINGLYPCKELRDEVSPLIAAIAFKNQDVFYFLLRRAANPNTPSRLCWTPFHYALSCKVHFFYVERLLAERADPNGDIHNPLRMTPLQTAVYFDRDDVAEAFIGAGAVVTTSPIHIPEFNTLNDKLSSMMHRLASNGVQICSEIKHFVDLDIAVGKKSPEEVFRSFDHVMLLKNPQTHLSVLDVVLGVTGSTGNRIP
ncbi:unnamed protein product [Gadus morhua 'NCC']